MKIRQKPVKKARIEIIPMIDVIFFLMVFFMISSLSMTKINSISVALPKTSTSPESVKQNFILTITKDGEVFVNKTKVALENVGDALAVAMRDSPQETLLVNADEGSNYGLVVKAMDQARKIGIRKFALSTEGQGSP